VPAEEEAMPYDPSARPATGVLHDLTTALVAGQPPVRYGGVRAHPRATPAAPAGVLARALRRSQPTLSCAHAMRHAGGVA
jgi:hypothetical protein